MRRHPSAVVIHFPVRATFTLLLSAICLVALTALTGSSDAVDPLNLQDQLAISSGALDANVIGQTFIFRFPRLHAIQVAWIISDDFQPQRDERVTLHLRARPNDTRDLTTASIPLGEIQNNAFSQFTFSPFLDSENQAYYFFLTFPQDAITRGSLALWSSADDRYPDGTLYVNGAPTARDLAFRAYYEPDLAMLSHALAETLGRFGASALFAIVLLLLALGLATRHSPPSFSIALALGALLAFIVALLQIRDLSAPLWVDSLAHARYIQFILDHTRLPTENFYHLGFHLLTAFAVRLFNLPIPHAILLVGQFIWVLVGLAVFAFSRKLAKSSLAGLASAACVWFLSPTPAYFITWGRYPLVLGAAILPLSLFCAIQLIEQPRANVRNILLAALAFAALAFSQIRLTAFYVAFIIVYLVLARQKRATIQVAAIGTFIFLFVALWLFALFANGLTWQSVLAQNQTAPSIDLPTALEVALTHHGTELWLLAALSIIIGIARRSRVTFLMLGWLILLGAIALTPPLIGELVPLSLIVLMAFLPAALVIGETAQFAYERLGEPRRIVHAAVWVAMIALVSVIGARDMVSTANPATILFTRADENAMQWVNANVPAHSKFLVNSFNWVGSAFVPSDGGGWIPYFTDNSIEYLDASPMHRDSESVLSRWIDAHKINYIYLGTRAGILHKSDFLSQPERFSLIYDRAGVKIFQIR